MARKKRSRRPQLTDRDFEIFDHLRRYRLTTREILHQLFFSDLDLSAVTKVTSRLVDGGYLSRYELYGSYTYFVVGPNITGYLGLARKRTEGLGSQSLPHEYGTLVFCVRGRFPRRRLLVSELAKQYPALLLKGVDSGHYFLESDEERTLLGHLRVDQGGTPDYIIRKAAAELESREPSAAFRELIHSGRFLLGVATGTKEKEDAIQRAFAARAWPPVQLRTEIVPELVQIVGRFQGV